MACPVVKATVAGSARIGESTTHGFQGLLAFGLAVRGWALVQRNKAEDGALQLRDGLSTKRSQGLEAARPWFLSALAGACAELGQAAERDTRSLFRKAAAFPLLSATAALGNPAPSQFTLGFGHV
jgi:hypothetical protein